MNPVTNQIERNLEQAKNMIDILGMLDAKTKGNLNDNEQRLMEHVLFELRMNYVDELKKDETSEEQTEEQKIQAIRRRQRILTCTIRHRRSQFWSGSTSCRDEAFMIVPGGKKLSTSKKWSACCLLLIMYLPLSCAYYSTSATGSGGIRSVAVPLLDNESLEAGIHQALTDSLIQGFVSDGALRVVEEDQADAVLQGTVLEIKEEPFTYGGQASAEQYQISVFVKMAFYDAREKQTLWELDRMRGYGIYDAATQRDLARTQGIGDALRMLSKDVVDRTQVGGW